MYGLYLKAQTPGLRVKICTTSDGANLCAKGQKGQCCMGFKITDLDAKMPGNHDEYLIFDLNKLIFDDVEQRPACQPNKIK